METNYYTSIYQKTKVIEHGAITASSSSALIDKKQLRISQAEGKVNALKILLGHSNRTVNSKANRINRRNLYDTYEACGKVGANCFIPSATYCKKGEVVIESWATVQSVYLDNSGPCTSNTSLDATFDVAAYIKRAQEHNEESIKNAGSEFKWDNRHVMEDISKVYNAICNEKYGFLRDEALKHASPSKYIYDKYNNPESPFYASDLTDSQRKIAYWNEKAMLKNGHLTGVRFQDSVFGETHIYGTAKHADENIFNRRMINQQLKNMLNANNISIPSDANLVCTVDASTCYISFSDQTGDGVDRSELIDRLEKAVNKGNNGKELYIHIRTSCFSQERMESSQYSYDGWNKFNYMHNIDDSSRGMSGDYNRKYKEWCEKYHNGLFSDEAKEFGLDGIPDMNLQIGLNANGFYDIYQNVSWSDINDTKISEWYSKTWYSVISDVTNTLCYQN